MTHLKGLPYYGGKSPSKSVTKWIVGLLGYDKRKSYIEPFAGMLGVLLSRPPVDIEIVNDLDSNLVNWWRCVRDHPEEMAYQIYHTPRSRELFVEAIRDLPTETDKIKRAVLYHTILSQGVTNSGTATNWGVHYSHIGKYGKWNGSLFKPLSKRLFNTQLENKNAVEILKRTVDIENTLIYCDPPYKNSVVIHYGKNQIADHNEFIELLQAQKGDVAISGYDDQFDKLDWIRHETQNVFNAMNVSGQNKTGNRTEVLWTNFEPKPGGGTTYNDIFD